jgi:hypothetical protein
MYPLYSTHSRINHPKETLSRLESEAFWPE